ncbi:cysteine hydrolase [Nocardia goodfellowii]|uniref:Nicotinamidase-related amidase n=1 Tax=Nocardia goodfellowii TaxID=882446 RepID=A0ABS4QB07_9NOCA|nr:cysteine hydrolase [Nocardia goodfellowii]MBP2188315.1 nicotinamidase-related amidase [Nocardia goodfellowii]
MATPRIRAAVLGLHWQVNVIRPEGFFGPMLAAPVARSGVVRRAVGFHAGALDAGVPVVFTRFTIPIGEGELVRNTGFMRSVAAGQTDFRPGSAGAQTIPEMAGRYTVAFDNQKLSGLAGSKIVEWLTEHEVDTLFLTGVATNLTVEQTARHGTDLGFTVHVVTDCVIAATAEAHAASLANLELVTAGSLTSAVALELLRRR